MLYRCFFDKTPSIYCRFISEGIIIVNHVLYVNGVSNFYLISATVSLMY
jgi:hypothetical protein